MIVYCNHCKEKQDVSEYRVFQDIKGRFTICIECESFISLETPGEKDIYFLDDLEPCTPGLLYSLDKMIKEKSKK